jgi:TetR/AcrR family transcriptional repressor of mexJK operon
MPVRSTPKPGLSKSGPSKPAARPTGPGRPKDMGKRAAILEAAKRMFTSQGFEGTSMDQIATEAGVSKLTVYSHFGDKETLFAAAVRAYCEQQLPDSLFQAEQGMPVRERLMAIAHAFYAMICSPEAVAGHRMLCAPQLAESSLPQMFWEAGPKRVQTEFAALLERRIATGELEIDDVPRAASQFFTLLKGDPHAQMVFGCGGSLCPPGIDEHLEASVDMFLRAYAPRGGTRRR